MVKPFVFEKKKDKKSWFLEYLKYNAFRCQVPKIELCLESRRPLASNREDT